MFQTERTRRLALLSAIAVLLGSLGTVGTAFAHTDNLNTSTTCTGAGCNLGTTTTVVDTINLCVSTDGAHCSQGTVTSNSCTDISTGSQLGTLCIYVYKAPAGVAACSGTTPSGTALSSGVSPTTIVIPASADNQGFKAYTSTLTLSSSTPAGNYAWVVQYAPPSGTRTGHDLPRMQTCEPFTLTGTFPPPPGVPQFPFGMALLLALAIPALLLVRSKAKVFPTQ